MEPSFFISSVGLVVEELFFFFNFVILYSNNIVNKMSEEHLFQDLNIWHTVTNQGVDDLISVYAYILHA